MTEFDVVCDRCGKVVRGYRIQQWTAGFYDMAAPTWRQFAREGERHVCTPCMHADPAYRAAYGGGPAILFSGPREIYGEEPEDGGGARGGKVILDDREFADLAAGNEIHVWMAISEALPPNVHVYWNTLLGEWRWLDEDSDGDVGGVLHPPYQDGQRIVVSSDIHDDMDAIVIRVIPEPRSFFPNTLLYKPYVWGVYLKKGWS